MRSCRQPSAVTVFSEWYFLTVNRPPFSPAPSVPSYASTIRSSREPAGQGRNRHHEPSGISGSIAVPVTRAKNMAGLSEIAYTIDDHPIVFYSYASDWLPTSHTH